MTTFIYGLACPLSGEIRYIGKSTNPKRRVRAHINSANNKTYDHHTARWIRSLVSQGLEPELEILEEIADGVDWRERERMWIATSMESGARLTNSTAGGEGLDYIYAEDKERYLENLAASMAEYRKRPEYKENIKRLYDAANVPEVIERRSEAIRKRYAEDEDLIRRISENSIEMHARPGFKEKLSERTASTWEDPEIRQKRMDGLARPEVKKVQSEKRKAAWADPETRERLLAIHTSPEVRARKSEAAKRRSTPEYRAARSEIMKKSWARRKAEAALEKETPP